MNPIPIFSNFLSHKQENSVLSKAAMSEVTVGMPVTRHPPHRSGHEELPHPAPTSGTNAETPIQVLSRATASRTRARPLDDASRRCAPVTVN
jgi:hypothetical protein